jgi:calcium-dependent protein kinase
MGGVKSKEEKNKYFQEIGLREMKKNPFTFLICTKINLTGDVIVTQSASDPEKNYKKLNLLGEGDLSQVYRVRSEITDSIRAMKIIKKSEIKSEDEKEIINEINILTKIDHPNVLKIFEFYSNKDSYSMILELCSGGELYKEIIQKGPFNEGYTSYVMYQIFSAINYCHKNNIIHRDLNPENILIIDRNELGYPRIKICDFGTSKIIEKGGMQKKVVGSFYYIAPEVLKKKYNEKCDIWSCGVIMYILLSKRLPFDSKDENEEEVLNKILIGKFDLESSPFDKVSKNAKDLITKLLTSDPHKRISAEEALNHPWFKDNKSKELFNQINDENILKKFVENLKIYKNTSVIQETALAYLVHNFPQLKDIINACKLFNQIDTNCDGKINKEELINGLKSKLKIENLESIVASIFKKLDMNNNGFIEYEEFVRAAVDKEIFITDNILYFAFKYFDKDGSGEITFDEIEEIFRKSIPDKSKVHNSLLKIIKQVDVNGDGKISFEEFCRVMKRMLKKGN